VTRTRTRSGADDTTPLGRELVEALEAVRDDRSGKKVLPERVVQVPDAVDVKAIRGKLGLSQSRFAAAFGFEEAAVRNWEQGRRAPEKTARILLTVIAHDPDVVREALLANVAPVTRSRRRRARSR
jgi:putative transcriptional regulator